MARFGPLRASRRPRLAMDEVWASAAILAALEALLVWRLGDLARTATGLERALGGRPVGTRSLLGAAVSRLDMHVAPLDFRQLAVWAVAGAAAVFLLADAPGVSVPLRFIFAYNAAIVSASAMVMLYRGRPPFEAAAFSDLYARTAVEIWLVLPAFLGVLSLGLPFRWWERLALVSGILIYDVLFSAVRFVAFGSLLGSLGGVTMAPLYLSAGPPLDFVLAVAGYSLLVTRLAKRVRGPEAVQSWTWI